MQHPHSAALVGLPRTMAGQSSSDKWKPPPPLVIMEIWEDQSCENVTFDDCWKESGRETRENVKCIIFLSEIFCFRNTVLLFFNLVYDPCFEITVHRKLAFIFFSKTLEKVNNLKIICC